MKNFNIFRVHWKIQFLGGIHKKQIYTGGLDSFQIQRRGTWQERGGWCFWGQIDTPMHTMDGCFHLYYQAEHMFKR